ncbi:MAG: hypothetical protein C4320_05980 [Armatimonadota bacterium]
MMTFFLITITSLIALLVSIVSLAFSRKGEQGKAVTFTFLCFGAIVTVLLSILFATGVTNNEISQMTELASKTRIAVVSE